MKIIDIRLKNLNSLKGEWHIDLTNKAYTDNGIFVITGPTGAGKTTIFDAICLALYGYTPRLGKIAGKNEIMTRKTEECWAQVIFEAYGEDYIAYWEQHRAGKSKRLQEAKHVLSYAKTGKIISGNLGDTTKAVQNIIGLDFKRFTQAVMLQQGGFDAFLIANDKERSQILELLTGTEIYGKISTCVYDEAIDEKKKLEQLIYMLENIKPLDNYESEEEILTEKAKFQEQLSQIESEYEQTNKAIMWLKGIEKIKQDLVANQSRLEQKQYEAETFEGDRRKLEAGLRAREVEAIYSTLTEKRETYSNIKKRCERFERDISTFSLEIRDIESKLPLLEADFTKITQNISEGDNYESVFARASSAITRYDEIERQKNDIEKSGHLARKVKDNAERQLNVAHSNRDKASYEAEQAMKNLDELTIMRESAIFEHARNNLKPGEVCPVCGSTEHPSIVHNQKSTQNITSLDDQIKLLRERNNTARENLKWAERNLAEQGKQNGIASANYENARQAYVDTKQKLSEAKSHIDETIAATGLTNLTGSNDTMNRLKAWLNECRNLDEQISTMKNRVASLKSYIEDRTKSLNEEKANLDSLAIELENIKAEFEARLKEQNFDSEEDFTQARIDSHTINKLQNREQEYKNAINNFLAIIENYTQKLEAEQAKAVTTQTLEELEAIFREQDKNIKALNVTITSLQNNYDYRQQIKAEREKLKKECDAQEIIATNWAGLNNLIGQKDGGKFREFSQRITLNAMIAMANQQLEHMNGRYILTAPLDNEGLKLNVIDKEQSGEIRPTENLSGGEKFIISLALALGLSQISGSKAKVDSLFLDEGFGSLDEEALNMALEALGEIKSEGRMIGIISHVQALKDRIATQINVIPKREGLSILEGPGCS